MPTLPDGVVWIASYPKSGNTWMRILLSNLMAAADRPEDINNLFLHDGIAGSREIFEEQTLVDSNLLLPQEIDDLRPAVLDAYAASKHTAAFIKAHDSWTYLPDGTPLLGRAARAALYLVRDPRDVAVSFAFHQAMSLDDAIERMICPRNRLGPSDLQVRQHVNDWCGHVRSWLDQTDLPVHLIRYEDLLADTPGVFRRALIFLGARFEDEEITRAVRQSDFAELQRQEWQNGFRERKRGGELFFRQGRVGDWRRYLSETQVHRIESAQAPMMERLGYELVTEREAAP